MPMSRPGSSIDGSDATGSTEICLGQMFVPRRINKSLPSLLVVDHAVQKFNKANAHIALHVLTC